MNKYINQYFRIGTKPTRKKERKKEKAVKGEMRYKIK